MFFVVCFHFFLPFLFFSLSCSSFSIVFALWLFYAVLVFLCFSMFFLFSRVSLGLFMLSFHTYSFETHIRMSRMTY